MKTYEIIDANAGQYACFVVIEYVDGVARGGDTHWLTRELAERAKADYEAGTAQHPHHPARR